MNQLRTRPSTDAIHATRARDGSARRRIWVLGLTISLSGSALVEAQTTPPIRQARRTRSREPIMTELNTLDAPAAAPAPHAAVDDAIRPFRAHVPEADVADLRRRLAATRWPDKETVADQSQGAQVANLRELVRYWGTGYD